MEQSRSDSVTGEDGNPAVAHAAGLSATRFPNWYPKPERFLENCWSFVHQKAWKHWLLHQDKNPRQQEESHVSKKGAVFLLPDPFLSTVPEGLPHIQDGLRHLLRYPGFFFRRGYDVEFSSVCCEYVLLVKRLLWHIAGQNRVSRE